MCNYFSRCSRHIRSLATFSFFATIFLRFSTDVWLSTLTEKLPPVVVLIFNVNCDKFMSLPHPICCWISCESLPIFVIIWCTKFNEKEFVISWRSKKKLVHVVLNSVIQKLFKCVTLYWRSWSNGWLNWLFQLLCISARFDPKIKSIVVY